MGIRSKALWQYLNGSGVLAQGEDAIEEAKRRYRKEYKRKWNANRIIKKHDVRLTFTPKEYKELKIRAVRMGYRPATYATKAIQAAITGKEVIPHKDMLLRAFQHVGICANILAKNKYKYPLEAEDILRYLMQAEAILAAYIQNAP
jgi:hypothetical protein